MYHTAAWARLRYLVLARDPICKDPQKTECHRPSTVADHIKDHRGDPKLFYDLANLQGLCKECHNAKTALTSLKG